MPRHENGERERERDDVGDVVRGDVDENRGVDGIFAHVAGAQCACDHQAAADAGGRERLIGEEFGEAE